MKLQINHITPYLNHKLMTNQGLLVGLEWQSIKWSALVLTDSKDGKNTIEYKDLDGVKLLLKPLSEFESFIRDIWENESDKQVMEYTSYEYLEEFGMYIETIWETHTQYLPLGLYNILLKYHYDIFGLIDNGLAEVKG